MHVKDGIVLRNIYGIFFLVDIHKKDYYSLQEIYSINQIGAEIWRIIESNNIENNEDIFKMLIPKLIGVTENMYDSILNDISVFTKQLIQKGFLFER